MEELKNETSNRKRVEKELKEVKVIETLALEQNEDDNHFLLIPRHSNFVWLKATVLIPLI